MKVEEKAIPPVEERVIVSLHHSPPVTLAAQRAGIVRNQTSGESTQTVTKEYPMNRTVTAMFDSRQEAEAAKARLQSSNIDAERIRVIDKNSSSSSSSSSGSSGGESKGFFASLGDMFMPDDDRHAYAEVINRGGYLVCAEIHEV